MTEGERSLARIDNSDLLRLAALAAQAAKVAVTVSQRAQQYRQGDPPVFDVHHKVLLLELVYTASVLSTSATVVELPPNPTASIW